MITLKNCEQCGNEFEAKRRDATFCSNNCRAHFHNNKVNQVQQPAAQQFQQRVIQRPQPIYGLGNVDDPRLGALQDKIEALKDEKQLLAIEIIQLKANQQIQAKIDEFKSDEKENGADQSGGGLMGVVDKVTGNDKLMDMLGNIIAAKFGGNGEGNDVFDGVDEMKKNNLQALLEICKTLPDQVVEMLLSVAGKAAQNPDGFMEGINKVEKQTIAKTVFIP